MDKSKRIEYLAKELAKVSPYPAENFIGWAHGLAVDGHSVDEIIYIMEKQLERFIEY